MKIFKIKQDGFKEIRKQMLIRTVPIMLVAVTVGIVISSINSKEQTDDINVLPIVIPLVVAAVGYGMYLGLNRQRAIFESYYLTFTNNLITREQQNTPTVSIYFNEVKAIIKHKNGSFTIKGKDVTDLIQIPAQIESYPELETILQEIQPIEFKDKVSFLEKYQSLSGFVTIGLMLCVYTLNNKIIVGIAGVTLVALMIWSFIKTHKSKNVDSKTKKNMWWIVIVLASVIAIMIFKLTGVVNMQKP